MSRSKLILILAVLASVIALYSVASAQQVPPHLSLLTVTIDGEAAPDGTVVTATMDGNDTTATVSGGQAVMVIEGSGAAAGKVITFMIGDLAAAETDTWEQGGHTDPNMSLSATSEPLIPGRVVNIDLAELNDSGQTGTATLTELGPNTQVVLSLTEGALETELVHIHFGQCGDTLGGVDQALTSFIGGSGASTKMLTVTLASLMDGDHAINAHEAGNFGNHTSCANIPSVIPAVVATAWSGLNQYLVDDRGMSLYLFTNDTQGDNSSACTSESCLNAWSPLFTGGEPVAYGSADESLLGSFERADGLGTQVTYNGWPMYYFVSDEAPGDTMGQGQFGVWWVTDTTGDGITSIGPAGAPGEYGARGATGSKGDKGDTGSAGATGPAGSAGAQGSTGPAGSAGAAGPQGEEGGGSSALAIVALILAIVSLLGAGGVFFLRRGST